MDVPVLVCTGGSLAGRRIEVPEGGLTLGRSEENDVVLKDDGVSRFHARLLYDNGSLWVQDAGSRNGVFVNGTRVTGHQALRVGDEVKIADCAFTLKWHDADDDTGVNSKPGPEAEPGEKKRWWWPF